MSKQILIELVGENETGYCYADLYLPASAEEIEEAKERANWNSDSNGIRDISIEHCSALPKLASFRLDSPTLDELNFLAQRLDAMDGGERTIMNGVLQYLCSEKGFADELVSMTDLINMTYGLDSVMIASNVGIAFLLDFIAKGAPGIKAVPFDEPLYVDLGLAWKKDRYISNAAQSFIDFCRTTMQNG